jgi:hypothetical protein
MRRRHKLLEDFPRRHLVENVPAAGTEAGASPQDPALLGIRGGRDKSHPVAVFEATSGWTVATAN